MHVYLGNLNKILFSFQKTNWERSKMTRNSAFQWDNFFFKKSEFFDFQWQISKFHKFTKNIKKTNNLIVCPKKFLKNVKKNF